jgi:hypothetical protein
MKSMKNIIFLILLFLTACIGNRPYYNYSDIISSDSISVKLTQGETIETLENSKIVLVTVTLSNKTQKRYYICSDGIIGGLNSLNGENIYMRFNKWDRRIFGHYGDSLPRARMALDSITTNKINKKINESISQISDYNIKIMFSLSFNDLDKYLRFINPKSTYVTSIPVKIYSHKKPDRLYFLYHDCFNAARNDSYNKKNTEYFNKYIKLPEILGGYQKLNGTLISDTLELK